MLNLALALYPLSPPSAGDKNLCGLSADFCLKVSKRRVFHTHRLLSFQCGTKKTLISICFFSFFKWPLCRREEVLIVRVGLMKLQTDAEVGSVTVI